jgi:protocatechuate 3,4-dioxygenase beta subunit
MRWISRAKGLTRRQALAGLAAIGGGTVIAHSGFGAAEERPAGLLPGKACLLTPKTIQGPFYFDPNLIRPDITEGKPGAPLKVVLQVVEAKDCAKIAGLRVDLWQADGLGAYSGYKDQETGASTEGQTFLRGTQFTDADGKASFATIYPGWYPGRTPHLHFKVFLDAESVLIGQLYFPDDVTDKIYAGSAPYSERKTRDTTNATDYFFKRDHGADTLCSLAEEGGSYAATLLVGVNRA